VLRDTQAPEREVCRHLFTCLNTWLARILMATLLVCPSQVWSAKCLSWPAVTRAHAPHFNSIGTEYHRKSGVNWINSAAKRQCAPRPRCARARSSLRSALGLGGIIVGGVIYE
jgi:hypothetical protein